MDHRVLEICYDIDAIASKAGEAQVQRLRKEVAARIDAVLFEDGLGHGIGSELSGSRLRLRCVVMDFDAAEARLLWALDDTDWGAPQEILRNWDARAVA